MLYLFVRKMILFATLFLLSFSSCHNQNKHSRNYDYADFDNLQIQWENFFAQKESNYYVYFYSEMCFYCESFKADMLGYISVSNSHFFLLSYKTGIPIHEDVKKTIGATSLDGMWFGGTPSLIYLENNTVKSNILGVQSISSYLNLT